MKLASPELLWFLPAVLFLLVASSWVRSVRLKSLQEYLGADPRDRFWPTTSSEPARRRTLFRTTLLAIGSICLLGALAGFSLGSREVQITRSRAPFYLVLDISQSMSVEDVPWGRLGTAKLLARRVASRLPGAPMGLTVFADETHQLLPPGPDRELLLTYLDAVGPDLVTGQGTRLEEVLAECVRMAEEQRGVESPAFLLMSDGEDESDADELISLASALKATGGTLSTVALGTEEGGPVPSATATVSFLRQDPTRVPGPGGNSPTSTANPGLLHSLAQAGGGQFALAQESTQVSALLEWFDARLGREVLETPTTEGVNRWSWLVGIALWALLLEASLRSPLEKPRKMTPR